MRLPRRFASNLEHLPVLREKNVFKAFINSSLHSELHLLFRRDIQHPPPQILRESRREPVSTILALPANTKLAIHAIRNRQRLHQVKQRLHEFWLVLVVLFTPHLQAVKRRVRPRCEDEQRGCSVTEAIGLTLSFTGMFDEVSVVFDVRWLAHLVDAFAHVDGSGQ